jgi:MFS transporter, ACS family, tartrate transporter
MLQQNTNAFHRRGGDIDERRTTMRKVYWRLLPLTILVYFLCYLDRINVGFAALTMNKDLGLDAATYGMAAGAFFWGYFLFEVPSNIMPSAIIRVRSLRLAVGCQ